MQTVMTDSDRRWNNITAYLVAECDWIACDESPPCEVWSSAPRIGQRVRDKLQDQEGEVIGHTSEVRPIVRWDDGTERSRSADDLERITAP